MSTIPGGMLNKQTISGLPRQPPAFSLYPIILKTLTTTKLFIMFIDHLKKGKPFLDRSFTCPTSLFMISNLNEISINENLKNMQVCQRNVLANK